MIKLLLILGAFAAQDQPAKRIDTSEQLLKPFLDEIIAFEEKQRREYKKAEKQRFPKGSDAARMQPDPERHWTDVRREKMGRQRALLEKAAHPQA